MKKKEELNLPKQEDLIDIPKDETVEATVVDLQMSTWGEVTKDEEKRKRLKNPKGIILIVVYDANGLIRRETFPIDSKLTTRSKYGRFLLKYNLDDNESFKPEIGMKVKVLFDGDGNSNIIIKR